MATCREMATDPTIEDVLFRDLAVGYRKDVTRWANEAELREGLDERLHVIAQQAELIGDEAAAMTYFSSAAKRKEPVFLSYAGADADVGEEFGFDCAGVFKRSSTTATGRVSHWRLLAGPDQPQACRVRSRRHPLLAALSRERQLHG